MAIYGIVIAGIISFFLIEKIVNNYLGGGSHDHHDHSHDHKKDQKTTKKEGGQIIKKDEKTE
jgi:solute carrier family 39 (zinc transporter), member 7